MPRVNFGFDAESVPNEHIFISYSRSDATRVKGIVLELHQNGVPIWYDGGLIPGVKWEREIIHQIRKSRITLFFLTANLFRCDDTYMLKEFRYATDHGKPILVVWLDEAQKIDCKSLDEEMYAWWTKLSDLQGTEVFHLKTDNEKAKEIFKMVCRMDSHYTEYMSRPNVHLGDKLRFGCYPQGSRGEIEPIEWQVIAIEANQALLLSDKLIDCLPFNDTDNRFVAWENCTLRKWLNSEFIHIAFSDAEQSIISSKTHITSYHPFLYPSEEISTNDNVYLLCKDEFLQYYGENNCMAVATAFACKKSDKMSSFKSKPFTGIWWTRDGNFAGEVETMMYYWGYIDTILLNPGGYAYVRPAIWISI